MYTIGKASPSPEDKNANTNIMALEHLAKATGGNMPSGLSRLSDGMRLPPGLIGFGKKK